MEPKSPADKALLLADRRSQEITQLSLRVRDMQIAARGKEREKTARLQQLRLAKEKADQAAAAPLSVKAKR